jgi:DNA-binding MarR family transcriptional regulator
MASNKDLLNSYVALKRAMGIEVNSVLRETGLGLRQFIILRSLDEKGALKVSDLVDLCTADAATISRSLTQLIAAGNVEKIRCEEDGRVSYVGLTRKGRTLIPQLDLVHERLANRCFKSLNKAERDVLSSLLDKVKSQLTTKSSEASSENTLN